MTDVASKLLQRLQEILPAQRPIALHEPHFDEAEKANTDECLTTGWVSTAGKYVDQFEQQLSDYTQSPQVAATVNGTAALHTCLVLAGVKANHEVIAPALTFVGTINPISYQNAVPHFVDCESNTLGIDPEKLEQHLDEVAEIRQGECINRYTGRVIKAIIVVHILGIIAKIEAIKAIAEKWHLTIVEDAAEALGSWKDRQHAGTWADFSALSFNGNKIITTGGGGAVLCKKAEQGKNAKHLTTTAKLPHPWQFQHDQVGYNYRLPNINAAIGCAQLNKLPAYLESKKNLAANYEAAFSDIHGTSFHRAPGNQESNHWLNLIYLDSQTSRDKLLQAAIDAQIFLRPLWNPMHELPMYKNCPKSDLSVSKNLWQTAICLPSSGNLTILSKNRSYC